MTSTSNRKVVQPKSNWLDEYIDKDPYFGQIFTNDNKDKSKYICLVCSTKYKQVGGGKKNFKDHLDATGHKRLTPLKDHESLSAAAKAIGASVRFDNLDTEMEDENKDLEIRRE